MERNLTDKYNILLLTVEDTIKTLKEEKKNMHKEDYFLESKQLQEIKKLVSIMIFSYGFVMKKKELKE